MSAVAATTMVSLPNPLDLIEEIVMANEWVFDRAHDDEMVVELSGRWCHYRMYFVWQREISALQFSCQFDMKVPSARRLALNELLANVNNRLWLGHFDVSPEDSMPLFRHTILLRGARAASIEQMEDLVEIALTESERYYPAFQYVIWGGKSAAEAVGAAILDTAGNA